MICHQFLAHRTTHPESDEAGSADTPSPLKSASTFDLPSLVTRSPITSSTTSVGMPETPYFDDSVPFRPRSANGSAVHGISPKYSSKLEASLSLDTKITSISGAAAPVYFAASCGVKRRQGGHQSVGREIGERNRRRFHAVNRCGTSGNDHAQQGGRTMPGVREHVGGATTALISNTCVQRSKAIFGSCPSAPRSLASGHPSFEAGRLGDRQEPWFHGSRKL